MPSAAGDDASSLAFLSDVELSRRLASDHVALLAFVGDRLSGAMPEIVRVQRRGLFNTGQIDTVTVLLGATHYELTRHHGHLVASTGAVSGGVVLDHHDVPFDVWVDGLLAGLAHLAATSSQAQASLSRLV